MLGDRPSDLPNRQGSPHLKRGLNLPLLTLYGLGVTIGAGIYVLVGATAAKAGIYAPVSFLLAAIVVAFTGFSYAELGTRYPVSAGEAAYVKAGFNSKTLSLIVGLLVVTSGIVSSAAISIGAAAYLKHFFDVPDFLIILVLILVLGGAAIWGIVESVTVAAIFTLIEIGGLALVVFFGLMLKPDLASELPSLLPPFEAEAWSGIFAAGLLAFFAFVGFEDIANVAEEVKDPGHTLPRAIMLTLAISTLVYLTVVSVVVLAVPMERLANSAAPLALIFEHSSRMSLIFTIIASIATINGILVQMIMASRVLYGLSKQKSLPAFLSYIHPKRQTPVAATALVVGIILLLALFFPIDRLAAGTSIIVLTVFVFVNLALIRLKLSKEISFEKLQTVEHTPYEVPLFVPIAGLITSLTMLVSGLI